MLQFKKIDHSVFIAFLLGLAMLLSSCSKSENSKPTENKSSQQEVAADTDTAHVSTYTVEGVVTSLPPGGKFIIINHEEIPGFMNAMKMPFYLDSPNVAQGINTEDSIKFTFEAKSGKMIVTDISKIE